MCYIRLLGQEFTFFVCVERIESMKCNTTALIKKKKLIASSFFRETIKEDESGLLEPSVTEMIQRTKRRKLLDREASVRLGIMRHVYIILDYSQAMTEQDLKPTRQICTIKVWGLIVVNITVMIFCFLC